MHPQKKSDIQERPYTTPKMYKQYRKREYKVVIYEKKSYRRPYKWQIPMMFELPQAVTIVTTSLSANFSSLCDQIFRRKTFDYTNFVAKVIIFKKITHSPLRHRLAPFQDYLNKKSVSVFEVEHLVYQF